MHPAWMLVSLAFAGLALRSGLRMRSARRLRRAPPPGERPRHLRLAKRAVVLVLVGFAGGPISAVWIRGFAPFGSLHSWLALTAALLFIATGLTGRTLEHGDNRHRERHALLAVTAVTFAAASLGTGFVLLP